MDEEAEKQGELAKDITAALRNWKSEQKIPLNAEVALVEIVAGDQSHMLLETIDTIAGTIGAKELKVVETLEIEEIPVAVKPIFAQLGPAFKADAREIADKLKSADPAQVSEALTGKGYELTLEKGENVLITRDFVEVETSASVQGRPLDTLSVAGLTVLVGK